MAEDTAARPVAGMARPPVEDMAHPLAHQAGTAHLADSQQAHPQEAPRPAQTPSEFPYRVLPSALLTSADPQTLELVHCGRC